MSTSDIDAAILATLNDPQLLAAMPNGVFWGLAAEKAQRYVVVDRVTNNDEHTFQRRSWEDLLYRVRAIGLSTTSPDMKTAEQRIDALLDGATITAAGYVCMAVFREEPIRVTERDDLDPTIRWFWRGGLFRVVMST